MKTQEELLITIRATPNEIIAMNVAINYFLRHCKHISPVYEPASQLLEQFQRRLKVHLPTHIS
ncbi:MAG TPA: hypothetical protein VKR06_45860 [Ktedonosporobacter sp.]|nr:hypothetical protein [Ktedonosporobacter sp.]